MCLVGHQIDVLEGHLIAMCVGRASHSYVFGRASNSYVFGRT